MPCKICKMVGHNSRTCQTQKNNVFSPDLPLDQDSKTSDSPSPFGCIGAPIGRVELKRYYCYILQQDNKLNSLNYVGYTVNFNRRIRQHNCIIKGGARYTKNRGPWSFLAVMTCSSWNNIRAMQVEWLIKHPTRARKRQKCFSGSLGKINSLVEIFKRIPSEEKINIYIHSDFISSALNLKLSENVEIKQNLIDI